MKVQYRVSKYKTEQFRVVQYIKVQYGVVHTVSERVEQYITGEYRVKNIFVTNTE